MRKRKLIIGLMIAGSLALPVLWGAGDVKAETANNTEAVILSGEISIEKSGIAPVQLSESLEVKSVTAPEERKCIFTYYDIPLDKELQTDIQRIAGNYGVSYELVLAVIGAESEYNSAAVGDNGDSIGLMQVQPRWWQEDIERLGVDIYSPVGNVQLGTMILSECLLENDGDIKRALKQYNSGNPDYPSDEYYNRVMEQLDKLKIQPVGQ